MLRSCMLGPYATEQLSVIALHKAIAESGLRPRGLHHEIYLGDPRKAHRRSCAKRSETNDLNDALSWPPGSLTGESVTSRQSLQEQSLG